MGIIQKVYQKYVQVYFSSERVRLGNLAPAIELHEAVTLEQLNELRKTIVGLGDSKESVKVAATSNVDLFGLQTIQGISLMEGDRIALLNQNSPSENGLWSVSNGVWTRTSDANTNEQVSTFMYFGVDEGEEQGKIYYLATTGDIELGATNLQFKEFGGSLELVPNRAITRDFNTIQGYVVQADNIKDAWEEIFYPSVPPVITLSIGSSPREMGANPNVTITWSVSKRTNGVTIITIAGNNIPVDTNIDEDTDSSGNTQNSTTLVSSTPNVSTTWTASVQTTNGVTTTKTITLNWSVARYWGRISVDGLGSTTTDLNDLISNPITDAQILALTGAGVGTGKSLNTNLIGTYNNINGAGGFLVFVCLTGTTPTFKVNGLLNTAFTKIRSNTPFTNGNGYIYNIDVWVSNTIQNSPISSFVIE